VGISSVSQCPNSLQKMLHLPLANAPYACYISADSILEYLIKAGNRAKRRREKNQQTDHP